MSLSAVAKRFMAATLFGSAGTYAICSSVDARNGKTKKVDANSTSQQWTFSAFLQKWLYEEMSQSFSSLLMDHRREDLTGKTLHSTAYGKAAVDFLSSSDLNLWIIGPRGVGKSMLISEISSSLHGGQARFITIDPRRPRDSILSQLLSRSWSLNFYVSVICNMENCLPLETGRLLGLDTLIPPSLDQCLSVLSDVLISEQNHETPQLPALLLIDSSEDSVPGSVTEEQLNTNLELLAHFARELNRLGAAQAVMTARFLRSGTKCRMPLCGGSGDHRCGVLYVSNLPFKQTSSKISESSHSLSEEEVRRETEENQESSVVTSVQSLLSLGDVVVRVADCAAGKGEAGLTTENQEIINRSRLVFDTIGGNLGKLHKYIKEFAESDMAEEDFCSKLINERELYLRSELLNEFNYFDNKAEHDLGSAVTDSSAKHFTALQQLLGDQVGIGSISETGRGSHANRSLQFFENVLKAFDSSNDAALETALCEYMSLVPPNKWAPSTGTPTIIFEKARRPGASLSSKQEQLGESIHLPLPNRKVILPVFEWVDLLDSNDKWKVRADRLSLKAFEKLLESSQSGDVASEVLLERLYALQMLRYMRSDEQQLQEDRHTLSHQVRVTNEAWDRAIDMHKSNEIDEDQLLEVQLKLDLRKQRHRIVDSTLRRRAVVIEENNYEAQNTLLRQRQRQYVKSV